MRHRHIVVSVRGGEVEGIECEWGEVIDYWQCDCSLSQETLQFVIH